MWNAIWEFFFCPQHGIIVQCWYMVPLVFAAIVAYWKQAVNYCRSKFVENQDRWYFDLWWWLRGVRAKDYRHICVRCGRPGQAHFDWHGCWRFKAKKITVILRHLG